MTQLAAQFLKEKKTCVEIALSMPDAIADIDETSDSIVPSLYVGQFARLLDLGDTSVMQLYVFKNIYQPFLLFHLEVAFSTHFLRLCFYLNSQSG